MRHATGTPLPVSGMSGNEIWCLAEKGYAPGEIVVKSPDPTEANPPQFLKGVRIFFQSFDIRYGLVKSASFGAAVEGKIPVYDATYAYKRPVDGRRETAPR